MLTPEILRDALERFGEQLTGARAPQRFMGTTGLMPRQWSAPLSAIAAAGSPTGTSVNLRGRSLKVTMSSHASAKVEIAYDVSGAPVDDASATAVGGSTTGGWFAAVPGTKLPAPAGGYFTGFRVRKQADTPSSADLVVIGVDYDAESEELGRFAQVSGGGAYENLLKILTQAGAEVFLEGAVGSAATRGVLAVGAWTGAAYNRILSSAAALGDAAASAAGELLVAAKLQVYDAVGDSWNRARSDVGNAGVSTLRVCGTTTPSATPVQYEAGAASGVARAAAARRRSVVIKNGEDPASTFGTMGVWINAGAAATNAHFRLDPGEAMTVTTEQEIHALREGAADVTLMIWDEVN